jgi:hypothetical protein
MHLPVEMKATTLGFALVIAGLVVSWVMALVLGGFKIGSLERRIELTLDRAGLSRFLEQFHRRVAELGFQPGSVAGQFFQGGIGIEPLAAFTHAKTKKQLTLTVHEHGPQPRAELSLRYLDPIVGDSGESAYRDAVLDFVTGKIDAMQVVPNRNFAAVCSLVGGVCTWIAVLALKTLHFEPLAVPILVMGITEAATGVTAIVTIRRKPGELTGTGWALAGIVASVSAILFAMALRAD